MESKLTPRVLLILIICFLTSYAKSQSCLNLGFVHSVLYGTTTVNYFDTTALPNGYNMTSVEWNVGNGIVYTNSTSSKTHVYSNVGNYNVCLKRLGINTTTGQNCVDSICRIVNVPKYIIAVDDTFAIQMNITNHLNVLANDIFNGSNYNNVYYTIVEQPQNGTVTIPSNNFFEYTPNSNINSCDSFRYSFCQNSVCDTAMVLVCLDSIICQGFSVTLDTSSNPNGSFNLTAQVIGGRGPVVYNWSGGVSSMQPTFYNLVAGFYCVTVVDRVHCSVTSCYSIPIPPPTDTICGVVFFDSNYNGVFDGSDSLLSNRQIYAGSNSLSYSVITNSNGYYSLPVASGTYQIYSNNSIYTIPSTSNGYTNVSISGGTTHCGFNFGITNQMATITGKVYYDANNNGVYDVGESPIQNQKVDVKNYSAFTNLNGDFSIIVPIDTYNLSISPTGGFIGHIVSPYSISVAATTVGNTYANNNFGLQIAPNTCNLAVVMTSSPPPAPGFLTYYYVDVTNIGSLSTGGTLSLNFPTDQTFNYANPIATSISTGVATWNVSPLAPGETRNYVITLQTFPSASLLGTTFTHVANLFTDSCMDAFPLNNTETLSQIVIGAYDPNDKQVWPIGEGANGRIRPETPSLDYLIRFQNTGTAPAVNVVLVDTLSAELDWSSLKMNGTSHSCNASINSNGILVIKYPNIMLPDSNANEPESHGHFSYTINLKPNRPNGTVINNTAHIYFDFNEAVVTNTTVNTIDVTLSIKDEIASTVSLHPNPFSDFATLKVLDISAEKLELVITDITGKKLRTISSINDGEFRIERANLSAGLYLYQLLQDSKRVSTGKMVVE